MRSIKPIALSECRSCGKILIIIGLLLGLITPAFGRIEGGSNYNTLYLQCHF